MKNWTDVYKFPLTRLKPYCQVFDQNRIHVFDFEEDMSEKDCTNYLKIINGEIENNSTKSFLYNSRANHIFEESSGNIIIDIRGWGYLTGAGGLNLSQEEAVNIQDGFAEFILTKLSNENL